jgi:hypothetical protein
MSIRGLLDRALRSHGITLNAVELNGVSADLDAYVTSLNLGQPTVTQPGLIPVVGPPPPVQVLAEAAGVQWKKRRWQWKQDATPTAETKKV